MTRKLLLISSLLLLAACVRTATPVPTLPAVEVALEEKAVYAAVLQQLYDARMYVLMDTTATDISGVENTEANLDYAIPNLTGISEETADGFRVRNDAGYPLEASMDLGTDYAVLSADEFAELFSINQSGWDVFYGRYPFANGITTLSRVGFNADMTQALVYVGTQSHWLAGAGYYVLLDKVEGEWAISAKIMVWIS